MTDKRSITDHITLYISFTNPDLFHYKLSFHSLPGPHNVTQLPHYHKIHHHIYQKPHHKYMYPLFSSNHPQHIFTDIIKTETIRFSRLSKTKDDYNFIRRLFTLRLTTLDYPNKLITENSFSWLPYYSHNQ